MMWLGFITILLVINGASSSADRNSAALKHRVQFQHNIQRRDQSICSDRSRDCGYGLLDKNSCECKCIPPYCFDDVFQSCASPGSCPNPFKGCTPKINCPYYAKPMGGECGSSENIEPGVYTIFQTAEECCAVNYPGSASCILTEPPTEDPSNPPTLETYETRLPKQIPTENPSSVASIDALLSFDELVAPISIPIRFYNFPSRFELNGDRRGEIEETVWRSLTPTADDLSVTIISVDLVGGLRSIFSELYLQITVKGGSVLRNEIQAALLKSLQDKKYEIANALKGLWGPETYTNSVVLSIGGIQTSLAPSPNPSSLNVDIAAPITAEDDGEKKSLPMWSVVLLAILFASLCGGLLVLQRHRDKHMDMPSPSHNPYLEEKGDDTPPSKVSIQDFNESRLSWKDASSQSRLSKTRGGLNQSSQSQMEQAINRNHRSQTSKSFNNSSGSRRGESFNKSCHSKMDKSFNRSRCSEQIDPEGDKRFGQSMSFTESAISITRERHIEHNQSLDQLEDKDYPVHGSIDQNVNRANTSPYANLRRGSNGQMGAGERKFDESGYDGGKSSFLISNSNVADDSSSEEVDADESSTEEGNVLGLLYYDGASSAGESEARESRRSRRSRRTTSESKQSSGKLSRNSSRKSSELKSSRSQRSRKKKKKPFGKSAEEAEYQQSLQDTPNFHGNNAGKFQCYTRLTEPSKDSRIGPIIHANLNVTPGHNSEEYDNTYPEGSRSTCSHGSTIKTKDSHYKSYALNDRQRQDDHTTSSLFNSAGECTSGLNNNPEIKF